MRRSKYSQASRPTKVLAQARRESISRCPSRHILDLLQYRKRRGIQERGNVDRMNGIVFAMSGQVTSDLVEHAQIQRLDVGPPYGKEIVVELHSVPVDLLYRTRERTQLHRHAVGVGNDDTVQGSR